MQEKTLKKAHIVIIAITVLTAVALGLGGLVNTRSAGTSEYPAGSARAFFDGAVIKWIVSNRPGGGYDEYARLLSPYLEKYTGARVQILNIAGAGGMRALGELFRSPADGLTIGLVNGSGLVTSRIAGVRAADYKIGELSFLARIVADTRVLSLSAQSKYNSFEDIIQANGEVRVGATGLGGSTYVDAVVIRDVFDLNMKLIHGFDNTASIRRAMLGGKIDGIWSSWGSARNGTVSGQSKVVLQSGASRTTSLPDVPTVFEFLGVTADPLHANNILKAWEALNEVGRIMVAPPGIETGKRDFLRESFAQALRDPKFLEDAARVERPVGYVSGEEMEDIVKQALFFPEDVQQLLSKAIRSGLQ